MSHVGPSAAPLESLDECTGALSPNTSAARLLTSDALTRALSAVVSCDLAGGGSERPIVSLLAMLVVAAEPAGAAEGAASGAGDVRGAGACAQADSAATVEM